MRSPRATLWQLTAHPQGRWAVLVVLVVNLVGGAAFIASAHAQPGPAGPLNEFVVANPWLTAMLAVVLGPPIALVLFAVWVALLTWFARVLDGEGGYGSTFTGTAFAGVPAVAGLVGQVPPLVAGPQVGGLISVPINLGVAVWVVILTVLAVRVAHNLPIGRAVVAVLMPGFVFGVILLIGVLALSPALAA